MHIKVHYGLPDVKTIGWRIGFLLATMVSLSFSVVLEMGPRPLVPFVPLHSFNIDFKEPVDYSFMLPLLCADLIISLAFLE